MASSLLRDREESERFDPFQDQEWQRFSACIRELGTKQALFFIVAGTSIVPFAPTRAMHDSRYSALTEVLQKLHLVNAQDATSPCLHLEQEQLFREAFDTFSLTLPLERVCDIRARSISVHTVPIEFIVKMCSRLRASLVGCVGRKAAPSSRYRQCFLWGHGRHMWHR